MELRIGDVLVHYVEHGGGMPLVALHGAGVDHRDIEAAIEPFTPRVGYRRIYPDLPGMGRSTTDGLTCNDDVVALLGDFIGQLSEEPVMLLGHSYGASLTRREPLTYVVVGTTIFQSSGWRARVAGDSRAAGEDPIEVWQ